MSPDSLSALLAWAMAARRGQEWAEARERFGKLLEAAREAGAEPDVLLAQTHLAIIEGHREPAEESLAQVAALLPNDERVAALGMLVAERWPAEPRDCETHLVARAKTFRRLCRRLPRPEEIALELGAAHGRATRALSRSCAFVYAVEKSAAMAERAREAVRDAANVRVIVASADDPGLVRAHAPRAEVVCLDIGGSTPLDKVMEAARAYRELYQPRVLIVRSVYLNNFVAGLASFEPTYGPSIWMPPPRA